MEILIFCFKFIFCLICWLAVTSIIGWLYSHLCTKLKRDFVLAPTVFAAFAVVGVIVGSIMAGLSPEDGFFSVAAVAAPASLIGCAVGAVAGLFFKERPMPRRKRDD